MAISLGIGWFVLLEKSKINCRPETAFARLTIIAELADIQSVIGRKSHCWLNLPSSGEFSGKKQQAAVKCPKMRCDIVDSFVVYAAFISVDRVQINECVPAIVAACGSQARRVSKTCVIVEGVKTDLILSLAKGSGLPDKLYFVRAAAPPRRSDPHPPAKALGSSAVGVAAIASKTALPARASCVRSQAIVR